jgi:hypothetical protein
MDTLRLTNPGWLPLNEYSTKYKISLSTLRRRIHSDNADYRFENGKYWLADRPITAHTRIDTLNFNAMPSQGAVVMSSGAVADALGAAQGLSVGSPDQVLDSANRFLEEIKRAYILVLQEKETQIMQLREEIVNLKTLVKILESDNERLRGHDSSKEENAADAAF